MTKISKKKYEGVFGAAFVIRLYNRSHFLSWLVKIAFLEFKLKVKGLVGWRK